MESIYCNMEKIIYVTAERQKGINKWAGSEGGSERNGSTGSDGEAVLMSSRCHIGETVKNILHLPYCIYRIEGTALGFSIVEYRIEGIGEEEAAVLEADPGETIRKTYLQRTGAVGQEHTGQKDMRQQVLAVGERKSRRIRWNRTLQKIKRQIQKREMQKMTGLSGDAFLFCGWREYKYPLELMAAFYKSCYESNMFVLRAEQLIFLDGWEEEEGDRLWQMFDDLELAFLSAIYTTYNYLTIVTDSKEFWREFTVEAYEEYGLSVRLAEDGRKLTFRDKKTLVVDLGKRIKDCCENFPPDSVYLDFRETYDKTREISVKCGRIPLLSLRNVLDTALKDTV